MQKNSGMLNSSVEHLMLHMIRIIVGFLPATLVNKVQNVQPLSAPADDPCLSPNRHAEAVCVQVVTDLDP